jgi:zeta-carotene desaturase
MSDSIVIIGGGFAGLTAGVALAGAGYRVHLLEQKPYLGGRARSFQDTATGSVVDNGQHIFMGCYRSTIRFLQQIGTLDRVRFQPRLMVNFLDPSGRVTTLDCPNLPAPWHLLLGVLCSRSFSGVEKLQVMRLGRALRSHRATQKGIERLSVEEWLVSLGQSESLRRNFWDLFCIAAMNEDPRRSSAVLFERILRLALFRSPADSRLGFAQVGLSESYTAAASEYITARRGRVETGRAVSGLLISAAGAEGLSHPLGGRSAAVPEIGVCEGVRLADGSEIHAQVVVSAAPWYQLARFLPADLLRSEPFFASFMNLRPAPIISINLWFDRPITDLEFVGLRGTTVQWLFNKSKILKPLPASSGLGTRDSGLESRAPTPACGPKPYGGRRPGPRTSEPDPIYVSLVLSGAHDHIGRSKEELLDVALRELGELIPEARAAKLVHSLVLKERFATFSPDCDAEAVRPPARTPIKGLVLAGDWTATGLPATIEGAVQSGYTAAQAVLEL